LHEDALAALSRLAEAQDGVGDPVAALATEKEVHQRTLQRFGPDSGRAGDASYIYFVRYHLLGRGVEALELAESSYQTRLKHYGASDPRTLDSLNAIGVINNSWLQRTDVALPLFTQIRQELLRGTGTTAQLSDVTFNLANTQYRAGLFDEAVTTAREASRLSRIAYPATDRRQYSAFAVEARALRSKGSLGEAVALGRSTLAEVEKNIPSDRRAVSFALQLLAELLSATGDAEALAVWERAYREGKQTYPPTEVQFIGLIRSYANELDARGRYTESIEKRRELVTSAEALAAQGSALGESRASAFSIWAESYRRHARNLLDVGRQEDALEVSERAKARLLLESIALRGAADAVTMTLDERAQLTRLRGQLQRADARIVTITEPGARTAAEIERNRIARDLEAHVNALRARYPRFGKLTQIQLASSAVAREALPAGTLLLSFVVGEKDILLFAMARDLPLTASRRPAPAGLLATVNAYRVALLPRQAREGNSVWRLEDGSFMAAHRRPDKAVAPVTGAQEIGSWLARQLLEPLSDTLSRYSRWVIAPDTALAHLPFDTLPWMGKRVIDSVQVTTTQSVSVYVSARSAHGARGGDGKVLSAASHWLGFGAPDYTELNRGLLAEASAPPRISGLRSARRDASSRSEFTALPNAGTELRMVAKSFKRPTLVVGAAATETRLRELDASAELASYQIVHVAAHGLVNPQRPALSAIVLGADGAPGADHDGFVTAAEWTGLTLNSDLVVLSACETGLGPAVSGEGVLGLPYALFVAGNRNAVLTLWPVADQSTSLFMREFFARLSKGTQASTALAGTKRDFARGRFGPRYRDPFHWAPFTLIGHD
jgi:CHAT domain-containing protein/tetratricopeptide (TPR) repeat protein